MHKGHVKVKENHYARSDTITETNIRMYEQKFELLCRTLLKAGTTKIWLGVVSRVNNTDKNL